MKNQYQVKKIDYLLSIVPALMLLYIFLLLGSLFFNWIPFDETGEYLTLLTIIVILLYSFICWSVKLYLPIKKWYLRTPEITNNSNYDKKKKVYCLIISMLLGSLGSIITMMAFSIYSLSIFSIAEVTETAQTLWILVLGFFYLVFLKVISDIYFVPKVYNEIKDRFYGFFEL